MAWADLASNQFVSFTDSQTSGFTPKQTVPTSNAWMTKQNWLDYYNVSSTNLSGYQSNQYVQKSSLTSAYIELTTANFQQLTGYEVRWYYVQNTIGPDYNTVVYSAHDTRKCNLILNDYSGTADLLVGRTVNCVQVPSRYGTSYPADQWPLVFVVIYNSSNGLYKRYNISEILNGAVIDSTYQSGLPYLYRLAYSATISGWPTTL